MIELLAIRFGEWLLIPFDTVVEAESAAEGAYEEYPGPYAPEAIFVDGKPRIVDGLSSNLTDLGIHEGKRLEDLYNQARKVEE